MAEIIVPPNEAGLTSLPPLSLYVHIPWCVRKCPYCDFNSHAASDALPEKSYIDALLRDLENELPRIWGRPVQSIFIGGGTPSLFQAASIDALLAGIRARVRLTPDAEITLEANPGTFERQRFQGFRAAGVNRLSLGVQSFDDRALHRLGRIHSGDEARQAIDFALTVFERINVDLMYALPKQTPEEAQADVQQAITLGAPHISAYQLTLEPNTAFAHAPPQHMPTEEATEDIESAVHASLLEHGFSRYEISAFCRDGAPSQHNLNYWRFGDYLGIGAGAHGKISSHAGIERHVKVRQPQAYLRAAATQTFDERRFRVPKQDLPFEFMLNVLRLSEGAPSHFFSERTGLPLACISAQLKQAADNGLIEPHPGRIQSTRHGLRFLNETLQLFLPED